MASQSRHSSPYFIATGQNPVALTKLQLGGSGHAGEEREQFIQDLVHKHPDIIPMRDIEPAFVDIRSLCTELPTDAGYLDNLWITPSGGIVLGECKLVRNPQARREVVAQALDYARALSSWRYEQFEEAVRKARREPTFKIWTLVSEDVEESDFVDAVERRLRIGQFLILIIGDGIQEGVEALTSHLQLHAGMHAGLALVDLSVWQGVDGGMLVVPRVPMRTVQIERGIVRIEDPARVRIEPTAAVQRPNATKLPQAQTQSEVEYFGELEVRRPALSEKLQDFLDELQQLNVSSQPGGKSLYLRWESPDVGSVTIASIDQTGKIWSARAASDTRKIGSTASEFAEEYLSAVARIANGIVKVYENGSREALTSEGKAIDVATLLTSDLWFRAIETFTGKLLEAES